MSLDVLKATHDFFRKPGSFDATLKKIPTIKNAGIRSVIMTTVSDKNISEIPTLIDVVAENGVDVYAFARYCPTSAEKNLLITPLDYRHFFKIWYQTVKSEIFLRIDLADIWGCEMEKYRDFDKFKKCSRCELWAWCRGCPAVSASCTGNFYEADPQCWKVI